MSTPYLMARRRNLYQPSDEQQQQTPDVPGTGTPGLFTPPPMSGYDPSLFQPSQAAPTSQPDAMQQATETLYGPSRQQQPTQDTAQPPRGIMPQQQPSDQPKQPQSVWERYNVRPPSIQPQPEWKGYLSPQVNEARMQGWAQGAQAENLRARTELDAAISAEQHQLQAGYYRNLPHMSQPYPAVSPADGNLHMFSQNLVTGEQHDLGLAGPKAGGGTPFEDWKRQNPTAPIADWFKIQPSVQGAQIKIDNPTPGASQLFIGPDGKPYAFDPRTKQAQPVTLPGGEQAPSLVRPSSSTMNPEDPKDIAQAIIDGRIRPLVQGFYRNAAPIMAELARRGFNQAQAEQDWHATQRFLSTLNNPQQVRLRQAIQFARESVPLIDNLYDRLNQLAPRSGFRLINRATIAAMKQLPGQAGATAQALETQLNHLTTELGNIYMGGNTPTDMSLRLGQNAMEKDWNIDTWKKNRDLLLKNLDIRANSINTSQPQGVSPGREYMPPGGSAPPPLAGAGQAAPAGTLQMKDGTTWQKVNGQWQKIK